MIAGKEQHVALYDIQHRQDVVRPIGDMCNTLTARMGTGGNNVPIMHNFSIVRRLTPTECERLQGLEDGYTDGGSDTARYKALGNGMAQPCADYVIRRIVECAEEVR
ncbi:DNA cytosine methyltransferase [Selenomonas noxia]|uniref:DNA cytosine methyltransferase n=1 Tax=Selenomonas noxia TaxID=135083 RepID=UPI0028803FB1|nr:DNA cytosine methyltransferase [Selenomonas noxia]